MFDLWVFSPGVASHGFAGLSLSLDDAVAMARVRAGQGETVIVVDAECRDSTYTIDDARAVAERHAQDSGPQYERPVSEPDWDSPEFWMFRADDLAAQDGGVIPGARFIPIHRATLRVLTDQELKAFRSRIFRSPRSNVGPRKAP